MDISFWGAIIQPIASCLRIPFFPFFKLYLLKLWRISRKLFFFHQLSFQDLYLRFKHFFGKYNLFLCFSCFFWRGESPFPGQINTTSMGENITESKRANNSRFQISTFHPEGRHLPVFGVLAPIMFPIIPQRWEQLFSGLICTPLLLLPNPQSLQYKPFISDGVI